MEPGEKIALARTAKRPQTWSQYTLARVLAEAGAAGISSEATWRSRIANYESRQGSIPSQFAVVIAAALGVDLAWLLADDDEPVRWATPEAETPVPLSVSHPVRAEPSGRIKIYGAVSAGDGNVGSFDVTEMDVPMQFARDDYGALVVEGDSMLPHLHSSDICIFRDWHQPKTGAIMAAQLGNGLWVVKQLVYNDEHFCLRSFNERYEDICDDFRLTGYLVGLVRDDGPERVIRLNPYGLKLDR